MATPGSSLWTLARAPPGQIQAGAWQRGLTPYLPTRIAAAPVRRGQNGYARGR